LIDGQPTIAQTFDAERYAQCVRNCKRHADKRRTAAAAKNAGTVRTVEAHGFGRQQSHGRSATRRARIKQKIAKNADAPSAMQAAQQS
jgi:hypothetical protein